MRIREEEHQKACALACSDIPSRREVEKHNLTHIPFRSWCNHCLRGRGRRSAHRRRPNSIGYMYLIEEDDADERERERNRDGRGSTDAGTVHAHQVKCKGSGDPWIATRIAADLKELGCGESRVVLKADQEAGIEDVQRQVAAVRSGETVPMNSHAGESQSDGRAENAVQRV